MKRVMLAAAAISCLIAPVANAMSVSEFLAKAKRLESRGILAIGSPDIKLLKDEMDGIVRAYRADLAAARKAGRPPHSCPPPEGKGKMNGKEFIAELEKIPVARRGMSMKTAFYTIMKKRYPCPAGRG